MSNTPNTSATSVAATSLFSSPSTTSLASYSTVNMPSQESTNPFQQNKCIRMKIKRNSAGQHMTSTTTHPPNSTSPSLQNQQSCKVTSLVTMANTESTPFTTCITVSKQQDHIFTYKIHHNMTQNNSNYSNSVTCKNVPLGCLPSLPASPQTSISQISDSSQHTHVTSKSSHPKSLPNKRSKLSHKDHSHNFSKNCNNFNSNSLLLNNNINTSNIIDNSNLNNNNNNIISTNNNANNINSINKSMAYSFNSNANNNSNSSINFNVNNSMICQKNNNSNNVQRFNNNNNNNNSNVNNNIHNTSSHTIPNSNNSLNTNNNNTSGNFSNNNNKNSNSSQRWSQHPINTYNTPLPFNEVNTLAYDNCPQCPPNNTDNQHNPLDTSLPHSSNFDNTKTDANKDSFMNNMNNSFGSIINNHPSKSLNKTQNNTSFNNYSNIKASNNQYNNTYHPDGSAGAYNIQSNPDMDPYEFNSCREDQGEVLLKKSKVPEKCERGCSPIKNTSNKDVEVDACHIGLITDPDCLGPCDPGTSVTLEGIVWNETENGLLVVNVTWRGKTYVGTLMDATKHHWAPPSDLDGRTQKGRGKRGRNNNNNSNNNTNNNVVPPPTPQNRNENGSDRKLRSNRNNNKQVQNNATPSPLKISEAKKNRGEIFASSIFQEFSRRASSRSESKALYSESSEDVPVGNYNPLSALVECPEENCSKKFRNMVGLKYHQSRSHQKQETNCEATASTFNATTATSSSVSSSKYNEKKNNEVNTKQVNDINSQFKNDIPVFSNKTFKNSPKAPYDSNEDNNALNIDKISSNKYKTFDSSKNNTYTNLENNDQNKFTENDDKESKSDKMNYRFVDKLNNTTTKSKNSNNVDYTTSDNGLHKADKDHFNLENGLDFESLKSKNNFKLSKTEIENNNQDMKHNFSNSNNFVSNDNFNNNNANGNNLNVYNLNKNISSNFNLFSMNNKTDETYTFSNNDNSLSNFSSLNNNHSSNTNNCNSLINLNEPTLKNINKINKNDMTKNMEKTEVSLEKKTIKSIASDGFSTTSFNNVTPCNSNTLNKNVITNNATLSTIESNDTKGSFLDNSVQQEQSFNFKKSFKNIRRNSPNKDDIDNKSLTTSNSCNNLRGFAPLTLEKPYIAKNTNSSISKNISSVYINNENSVDSNLIYNNNANKESNNNLNSNLNQSIDYPIEKGRKKKRNNMDKNNANKFYNANNLAQNNLPSASKNYSKNNNNNQNTGNFKTTSYTTSMNKTPHKDITTLNEKITPDPVSSASNSFSFLSSNLINSKTTQPMADAQQYPYSFYKNDNNSAFLNNNNDVLNTSNINSSVAFTPDTNTLSIGLVNEAINQNESVEEFLGRKQKLSDDLRNSPSKASSEVTIIHGASSPAYSDISDANENAPMLEKEANETTLVDEDAVSERRCSPASINEEKSNQSFVNSPFYRLMPRLTPAVTSPIIQSKENLAVSSVSADLLTTSNFFCNNINSFDEGLTGTYYNNDGTLDNSKNLNITENKVNVPLDTTKTFNDSFSEFKSVYNSKVKEKEWPYLFSGEEKAFNKEDQKSEKREELFFPKKSCFGYQDPNCTETNLLSSTTTTLSSSAPMTSYRPSFYKGNYSTRESEYSVQMERYAQMQQKPLLKTPDTSETYNQDQEANQLRNDEQKTETSFQTTAALIDPDNNKSKNLYLNKDSFKNTKHSLFSTPDTSFGSDIPESGSSNNLKNNGISSGSNRNSFNEKSGKKYPEQGSKGFFNSNQKLQSTPSLSKLYYPGEGGGKPAAVVAPQTRADRLINNNPNIHRNNIANNTNTTSTKVNDTEVLEGKSFQTNRKTPIDDSVGSNQESSCNNELINTHEINSNANTALNSDNKNLINQNIPYLKSPRESRNTKEDSSSKKDSHKQAKSKSSHSDNSSMSLPSPHSSLPSPFPHSSHSFYSPYLPPAHSYPGVILNPFESSLFPSMAALSYSLHPNQLMHGVPSVGLPPTSSSSSTDINPKLSTTNFFHHRQEYNTTPTSDHHKIHDLKDSEVSKVNEESTNQFKESSNSIQTFSTNHSSLVRGNGKDEKEKEEPTLQRHLHTHHHMHVLGPSMYPFLTSEAAAMFTGSQANAVLPSHLSRHSYIGK